MDISLLRPAVIDGLFRFIDCDDNKPYVLLRIMIEDGEEESEEIYLLVKDDPGPEADCKFAAGQVVIIDSDYQIAGRVFQRDGRMNLDVFAIAEDD